MRYLRRVPALTQRLSVVTRNHSYAAIGLMLATVTGIGLLALNVLKPPNVEALFLLVVLFSALNGGRRAGIIAALASSVVFDFCFIPPRFSFAVTDFAFLVMLLTFVFIAVSTSELASRTLQEQALRTRAEADMHAKDVLLDRIAHGLRAPLTTILGWVQILQQSSGDAQRTTRGLAGLQRNAQLLARLVGDLLDVSRIHVGKFRMRLQPIALAPVVSQAMQDGAFAAAEKGVTLETSVEAVGCVLADEHRIEQLVMNLVSNAVKFTPVGGRITVNLSGANGNARLLVADTGEGIPPDFIPHVFEPFNQGRTKNSTQGLGLGLAIVKQIVDAHHGQIRIESTGAGRGTTFVIELPLAESTMPAPADLMEPATHMIGKKDDIVLH